MDHTRDISTEDKPELSEMTPEQLAAGIKELSEKARLEDVK